MHKSHSDKSHKLYKSKDKDKINSRRKFKLWFLGKALSIGIALLIISALLTGQVTAALSALSQETAADTAMGAGPEAQFLPAVTNETMAVLLADAGQDTLAGLPRQVLTADIGAFDYSMSGQEANPDKSTAGQDNLAAKSGISANLGKTEVVYAVLDTDGRAGNVHVVNHFELAEQGEITDYGSYDEIIWLTGNQPLQNGNVIIITADAGKYYYEGVMKNAKLPWNFTIEWFLDDRQVEPAALSGAEGNLKIVLTSEPDGSADPDFIDNFILQIGVSLPRDATAEILAEDATIAEAGNNTLVTFVALNGGSDSFELSAKVKDFYMPSISISAVKLDMGFEIPDDLDFAGDMSQLTDAISDLKEGTDKLNDGGIDLSQGMGEIAEGSDTLASEGDNLVSGIAEIAAGADKYAAGISSYLNGVDDYVAGVKTYTNGVGDLAGGAAKLDLGVTELASGLNQLSGNGEQLVEGSEQIASALQEINDGLAGSSAITNPTAEDLAELDLLIMGSAAIKGGLDSFVAALAGDGTAANPGLIVGLEGISSGLGEIKVQLDSNIGDKVTVPVKPGDRNGWVAYLNGQPGAGALNFGEFLTLEGYQAEAAVLIGVLDAQMDALIEAANQGNAAIDSLTAFSSGIGELKNGQDSIVTGLELAVYGTESQPGLKVLADSYAVIDTGINELVSQIKNMSSDMGSLPELIDGLQQLSGQYDSFHQGLEQYTAGVSLLAVGVSGTDPDQPGLKSGFSQIASGLGDLNSGGGELRQGGTELVNGGAGIADGGLSLSSGLSELESGASKYINGVKDLGSGLREYEDGLIAYTDGVSELAEGVGEFEAETQDIDQQMLDEIDKKIDEYLNKDFIPNSFVSTQNENVEAVQFVFMTQEIPRQKTAVIEVPKEESGGFWDRVQALFGG